MAADGHHNSYTSTGTLYYVTKNKNASDIKTDTVLVGMKTGDQPSNKIRRSELLNTELPKYRYLVDKDHAYNNNNL
jgi:hypothetical protein